MRCCLLSGSEEGYAGLLWRAGGGPGVLRGGRRRLAVLVYLGGQGDILGENRLADAAFREDCAQGLLMGVLDFLMEYPLAQADMSLLESVGYLPPSLAAEPPGTAPDRAPEGNAAALSDGAPEAAELSAPRGMDSTPSPAAAALPAETPAGAPPNRAAVSPVVPRVVGGSVVVPGTPPGYIFPARVSSSVQVPVSWPSSGGSPPGWPGSVGAGPASPSRSSGQVAVRQPFG